MADNNQNQAQPTSPDQDKNKPAPAVTQPQQPAKTGPMTTPEKQS
jgi:hypothetical protein